jgi:hypothetical protein
MRSGRTQQKQIGRLLLKGQQAKSKTQPKPERESATRLPPHFREEETLFQFTYNSKSPSVSKVSANGITATIPIAMDGEVSRADAPACFSLYNLQQARLTLDAAHRDFLKKAVPLSQEQTSSRMWGCVAALSHPPPLGGRQGPFPPLHLSPGKGILR